MIPPLIARKEYTLDSFTSAASTFVGSGWFGVLDSSVIHHFASRLTFPCDALVPMIKIATLEPYSDPLLNYGIIDCMYSSGQILHSVEAVALLEGSLLSSMLTPLDSKFNFWSMRECYALSLGNADFAEKYGRSSNAEYARRNLMKDGLGHPKWCVDADSLIVDASVVSAIASSSVPVLTPFTARRSLVALITELEYLDSKVTTDFSSVIRKLTGGDKTVDVIPAMIAAGANVRQISCMGLPWELLPFVKDTQFEAACGVMTGRVPYYLPRELIIIDAIVSMGGNDGIAVYSEVVLKGAPPGFNRKAINAIRHVTKKSPEDLVWRVGARDKLPLFISASNPKPLNSNPDATTYEPVLSPARPAASTASGFSDVSKPVPRKSSDPISLGSLRAGASPTESSRLDKVEADVAALAETNAAILQMLTKLESKL